MKLIIKSWITAPPPPLSSLQPLLRENLLDASREIYILSLHARAC